jgi:hypothetical protein
MAIAGRVLLGSNAKRASKHREELEQRAKELERDIQLVRQEYQSFVSVGTPSGSLQGRAFPRPIERSCHARPGRLFSFPPPPCWPSQWILR